MTIDVTDFEWCVIGMMAVLYFTWLVVVCTVKWGMRTHGKD